MDTLSNIFIIACCLSAISFTITFTSIFKWLRELLSKIHPKIEELIHCPWCLSHWILIISSIFIYDKVNILPITFISIIDYIIVCFAIICISGIFHYVLLRAYEPVSRMMINREIEKLN